MRPDHEPYLSVVVAARNDDHGGNLLGRMQAFVNAFLGQCRRHRLDAELIIVEWNPPPDREPLARALCWPADFGPCRVRFIQVPPELHRRYRHAEALPLYQMIAKNAGIRRARGRFVLATNIDILLSDELARFLAERRLQPGRMYRIDRYDVMSGVPPFGSLDEQLDYCRTHLLRINTRHGTFPLTPSGARSLYPVDIADAEAGVTFGDGWYAPEPHPEEEIFRGVSQRAEFTVHPPAAGVGVLVFDLEPGPSAAGRPIVIEVLDSRDSLVVRRTVEGRTVLQVPAPPGPETFRLQVIGGSEPIPNHPFILNFRVFRCRWSATQPERAPSDVRPAGAGLMPPGTRDRLVNRLRSKLPAGPESDIADPGAGLHLGAGWYPPERRRGRCFRWVPGAAELIVSMPEGPPRKLVTRVQPGPLVGYRPSILQVRDRAGNVAAGASVRGLQKVELALPWRPGRTQVFTLHLLSGGRPVPVEDPRALRFRVFRLRWSPRPAAALPVSEPFDIERPEHGWSWGWGWNAPARNSRGDWFRCARNGAELVVQAPAPSSAPLYIEAEPAVGSPPAPRSCASAAPLQIHFRDSGGRLVSHGAIQGRQLIFLDLALAAGRTEVFTLDVPGLPAGAPALHVYRCGWAPQSPDIFDPEAGIAGGEGWSAAATNAGRSFRVLRGEASLLLRPGPGEKILELELEPAQPGQWVEVEVTGPAGRPVARCLLNAAQRLRLPVAAGSDVRRYSLCARPHEPGRAPGAGESEGPDLRVHRCRWVQPSDNLAPVRFRAEPAPAAYEDILPPGAALRLGRGWYPPERAGDRLFRWACCGAEIEVRPDYEFEAPLWFEIESGPALRYAPFVLEVADEAGRKVFEAAVDGRRKIALRFPRCAGIRRYRLLAAGGAGPCSDDPRTLGFRVFAASSLSPAPEPARWQRGTPPQSPVAPLNLHTNACGDFTLMAREHWFGLRGYPEFDLFSMNLDSVLCYAAHHAGVLEEVLRDPLRIYHIEHAVGSGWTPEGERRLYERIAAQGLSFLQYEDVMALALQMRRLNGPLIFNLEDWGLAGHTLPETELPNPA